MAKPRSIDPLMIKPKIPLTQQNASRQAEDYKTALSALHELTDQQRQTALNRYRQIAPFIQGLISLPALCQENKIPLRTARTWVRLYQRYGLSGFG